MEKQTITKDDIGTLDLSLTKKDPKKLHLDSEYRRRWQEYHLTDGTFKDSRKVNWREVEWEKVVKIVTHMDKKVHFIDKSKKPDFKFFMCFRWGGQVAQYDKKGEYIGHTKINTWCHGWTDGVTCYLEEIDFYTGTVGPIYLIPLDQLKGHVHPRVQSLIKD